MRVPTKRQRAAGSLLGLSLLLAFAIWVLLPARYLPVDLAGSALALLCAAAGLSLLMESRWALPLARLACWTTLVLGTAAATALAWVAAHLAGLYGPVGAGGALLLGTVALLVLPYLVGLPVLQLAWLRAAERTGAGEQAQGKA